MNTAQRQHLEDQLLLRSTGELSPEELNALDTSLVRDAEAADFANFIAQDLPTAALAPRDFAAEAITAVHNTQAPRDFAAQAITTAMPKRNPMAYRWALAAAAAVLILSVLTMQLTRQPNVLADATPRTTVAISERLNNLETELTTARTRFSHGRYATSTF